MSGPPSLQTMIATVRPPDTRLAQEALAYAWEASPPFLFNHVMRSYYLGRLMAGETPGLDDEVVFLSSVLHDLGLTEAARGPRHFELEGADAAKRFLEARDMDPARRWLVWDTIALHPWSDLNLQKEPEARVTQLGIMADVVGAGLQRIASSELEALLAAFPRLGFKGRFFGLLCDEARAKPQSHAVHPVHMAAEHCCGHVPIPDAQAMIEAAPFTD